MSSDTTCADCHHNHNDDLGTDGRCTVFGCACHAHRAKERAAMGSARELAAAMVAQIREERAKGDETLDPRPLAEMIADATDPVFAAEMVVALGMKLSDARYRERTEDEADEDAWDKDMARHFPGAPA